MTTPCRICTRPHQRPPVGPADYRCPACQAAHRYWRSEQLGTRAQVSVRCRWSAFDGCAGVGRRVDKPADGWKVRLLDGDGRELYFGAGSVDVDWEIHGAREPERGIWAMAETRTRPESRDSSHGTPFRGRP